MLLKILPASSHYPILKPLPYFQVFVTVALHFQYQNLYQFFVVAVSNYHKIYYFVVLQDRNTMWVSLGNNGPIEVIGTKSRCQENCVPFWRLQGRIYFLNFPVFRGCQLSLALRLLPPSLKPAILGRSLSHCHPLVFSSNSLFHF